MFSSGTRCRGGIQALLPWTLSTVRAPGRHAPSQVPPIQSGPAHGSCLPAKQGGARACHACIVFRRPSSQVDGLYAMISEGWTRGQAGVERS